jgi:hypothetical protein
MEEMYLVVLSSSEKISVLSRLALHNCLSFVRKYQLMVTVSQPKTSDRKLDACR